MQPWVAELMQLLDAAIYILPSRIMDKGLLKYDVRVLLALQQAIAGSHDFFRWLVDAHYPELAAFSNFLQDDGEAEQWLVQHHFHWLGIMSHAIDGDQRSRMWIKNNLHEANLMFVLACRQDDKAISWLKFMNLEILQRLAQEVASLRNRQELDTSFPYKMRL